MAKVMNRIGQITESEVALPKEDADATLWDCDERALRFLLEDGKINLCLRNLIEFKEAQRKMRREKKMVPVQLHESMVDFEKGSGLTLKNAWLR